MLLQVGDRFRDEEGVWEVTGHPFTTREGKVVHAMIQQPGKRRAPGKNLGRSREADHTAQGQPHDAPTEQKIQGPQGKAGAPTRMR